MWAALLDRRSICLTDAEADPRYSGTPGNGHLAMAFVPLVSGRGPQGVLVAHRPRPQAFDRLQLRQLEALAVPIAETLTVARLLVTAQARPQVGTCKGGSPRARRPRRGD